MEYIIKSDSYRLLKNKINILLNGIEKDNIIYYDLTFDNIKEILEECNYNSLFNDKKGIVVYNSNIFGTKYEYKEELNLLDKYLDNPNPLTILIFIADSISIKKRSVKLIKDKGNLIELNMPKEREISSSIKKYLTENKYKIDNIALSKLITNSNNNYDFILNEIDKLFIVKKDNIITLDDINKYTVDRIKENIFDFVDSIIKKDNRKIKLQLSKFIYNKEEVAILFSNVATQYRLMYSIKYLLEDNMKESDIASYLEVHPYRIKLAIENGYNYTKKELKDKILYIGSLDEKIKSGTIDKYVALKMFLVNL